MPEKYTFSRKFTFGKTKMCFNMLFFALNFLSLLPSLLFSISICCSLGVLVPSACLHVCVFVPASGFVWVIVILPLWFYEYCYCILVALGTIQWWLMLWLRLMIAISQTHREWKEFCTARDRLCNEFSFRCRLPQISHKCLPHSVLHVHFFQTPLHNFVCHFFTE